MSRYVVLFMKDVLGGNGRQIEICQSSLEIDAINENQATELAKQKFCEAERLREWSLHADRVSVKNSMGLMSDGMAVAMYTTLTGLIGSVLLQMQYYLLDDATAKVFGLATDLTEVFVVSVLEREHDGQLR